MKKGTEQQTHSMPYVKSSTEHQLSRALLTLQWNMHQIILFLWYIVQKLAIWTGKKSLQDPPSGLELPII